MNFNNPFSKAPAAKVGPENTEVNNVNELSPDMIAKIESSKVLIDEVGASAEAIANDPSKNSEKDNRIRLNWSKVKNWSLVALGAIAAGAAFATIKDQGALTNAMELATHLPAGFLALGAMFKGIAEIILQSDRESKNPEVSLG